MEMLETHRWKCYRRRIRLERIMFETTTCTNPFFTGWPCTPLMLFVEGFFAQLRMQEPEGNEGTEVGELFSVSGYLY